jgi:hypothetical protein
MPAPAHRTPRRKPSVPVIVGLSVAAVLIVVFGAIALASSMSSGPVSDRKVAAPASSEPPTTQPTPTPTGIDPTDLGSTPSTAATSESSSATPSAPAPKPLNTGNGSGCDVGKNFQAQLQTPVSGPPKFKGTACLKKGQSVWAFNFQMDNSLYILVSGKSDKPAPIVDASGVWNWTDSKADTNTVVNFVLADKTCSDWIAGQDPNNDFGNQIVLNNLQKINEPGQPHCQVIAYQQLTTPAGN